MLQVVMARSFRKGGCLPLWRLTGFTCGCRVSGKHRGNMDLGELKGSIGEFKGSIRVRDYM